MEWLRRVNWMMIALVVGPLLVVISLVALRSKLWGPALDELRMLVKEHDVILREQNDRQREMLRRQERILEVLRDQGKLK